MLSHTTTNRNKTTAHTKRRCVFKSLGQIIRQLFLLLPKNRTSDINLLGMKKNRFETLNACKENVNECVHTIASISIAVSLSYSCSFDSLSCLIGSTWELATILHTRPLTTIFDLYVVIIVDAFHVARIGNRFFFIDLIHLYNKSNNKGNSNNNKIHNKQSHRNNHKKKQQSRLQCDWHTRAVALITFAQAKIDHNIIYSIMYYIPWVLAQLLCVCVVIHMSLWFETDMSACAHESHTRSSLR